MQKVQQEDNEGQVGSTKMSRAGSQSSLKSLDVKDLSREVNENSTTTSSSTKPSTFGAGPANSQSTPVLQGAATNSNEILNFNKQPQPFKPNKPFIPGKPAQKPSNEGAANVQNLPSTQNQPAQQPHQQPQQEQVSRPLQQPQTQPEQPAKHQNEQQIKPQGPFSNPQPFKNTQYQQQQQHFVSNSNLTIESKEEQINNTPNKDVSTTEEESKIEEKPIKEEGNNSNPQVIKKPIPANNPFGARGMPVPGNVNRKPPTVINKIGNTPFGMGYTNPGGDGNNSGNNNSSGSQI